MAIKFSNNFGTTLGSSISSGATSFTVASASGFPSLGGSDYVYVTIASEVVKVTATSGTTFTCDATSGGHSAGATVEIRVTAEMLEDFATDAESLPVAGGQMSGNITMAGSQTVDGRDLSVDGAKLDNIEANATADQSATEIKTLLEDGIDSVHYVDGSIDTAHIADDQVTADKLANSINTAIAANTAKTTNATHTGEVTGSTALTIVDNIVDEANLKVSNDPSNGYFLSAQSGATGGMTWAEVDALPSQSGNSGKYLTTNGSAASWAVLDTDANTTTKGLYEHAHTISSNYTISSGNNAFSAGDITINSGISVTIPSSSQWVIT